MYPIVLTLHNIMRWLVILAAVYALVRMYSGLAGRKSWSRADDRAGMLFTIMLDIQILLGIILYVFLSPTTTSFLTGQAGMGNALVRYFAVEHTFMMVIAAVLAHVGRSLAKKGATSRIKFRIGAIWFTIAVLLILFAIPWPFLPTGRPWLRLGNTGF
jgi:hypothetical protein